MTYRTDSPLFCRFHGRFAHVLSERRAQAPIRADSFHRNASHTVGIAADWTQYGVKPVIYSKSDRKGDLMHEQLTVTVRIEFFDDESEQSEETGRD